MYVHAYYITTYHVALHKFCTACMPCLLLICIRKDIGICRKQILHTSYIHHTSSVLQYTDLHIMALDKFSNITNGIQRYYLFISIVTVYVIQIDHTMIFYLYSALREEMLRAQHNISDSYINKHFIPTECITWRTVIKLESLHICHSVMKCLLLQLNVGDRDDQVYGSDYVQCSRNPIVQVLTITPSPTSNTGGQF